MNIVDIINKKRLGEELNWEELEYSFLVHNEIIYTNF